MLTYLRIKLLDQQLLRLRLRILRRRVEVPRPSSGNKFNENSRHSDSPLDLHATSAHLAEHGLNTILVNGLHRLGGNAQRNPTFLGRNPESLIMQVR